MQNSSNVFKSKFGYDLYKGTSGIVQLLAQAEIDVLGISFDEGNSHIYAIDIAFHEAGLNYGSKDETVSRVIKKCIRSAMCIYGYFDFSDATIIFTSPKINLLVLEGKLGSKLSSGTRNAPSYNQAARNVAAVQ